MSECEYLFGQRITGYGGQPVGIERFDGVVPDQPDRPVAVRRDRTDVSFQDEFEIERFVVEVQQPVVGSHVQPFLFVRDYLSIRPVGTRGEVCDPVVHPHERRAVVHEQGVVPAEPDASDAVLGDAVYASVIGGFGHGMEPVIRNIQGVEGFREQSRDE